MTTTPAAPGPSAQFQAFLDAGELRIQRSRQSGRWIFEPRLAEPGADDADLEWAQVDGHGTVYSVTVIHVRPPGEPYAVVLVDLDEGVRLMAAIEDLPPAKIEIGLRVRARISVAEGRGRLGFVPAA